jgi:uncharacterized protein (DUF4415 family)
MTVKGSEVEMLYNVSWEVSHPSQENQSGVMPVEAVSEKRAVEMAQHALEEQFPGEDDYVLLECQVRKPGRPRERRSTYERITLEIKPDLLARVDSLGKSRREVVEIALEQFLATK